MIISKEDKSTCLDGIGTVLNRFASIYFSAGENNVISTKRSLKDDRRTKELADLNKKHPVDVYLDTSNLDQFSPKAAELGLRLKGKRSDINFEKVSYIINGMDDKLEQRIIDQYKKHGKKFLLQGGADYEILKNDFLSAPNVIGTISEKFVGQSARQVSCNTTYCGTALGLLLNSFSPERIERIDLLLQRRSRDPGEFDKELLFEREPKLSHHAKDVEHILPQLKGKINSTAQKMPWEHYHRAEITIKFKRQIDDYNVEIIKESFKKYERCVYVSKVIGEESIAKAKEGVNKLLELSEELKIPDGDILLPTYSVEKKNDYSIKISGYNPQRSIIALSCLDWYWIVQGKFKTWKDGFQYTNDFVKWHDYSIKELKSKFEEKLNSYIKSNGCRVSER